MLQLLLGPHDAAKVAGVTDAAAVAMAFVAEATKAMHYLERFIKD